MIRLPRLSLPVLLLLGGCALHDSRVAHRAQERLVGLSELELEACLGAPDQHSSFPGTDVLTYATTSSSSMSYSVPIVGGLGFSNGGSCHATFRVDGGVVTNVLYSGEKNATLAPDAYCAPIVRTCLAHLAAHPPAAVSGGATATTRGAPTPRALSRRGERAPRRSRVRPGRGSPGLHRRRGKGSRHGRGTLTWPRP